MATVSFSMRRHGAAAFTKTARTPAAIIRPSARARAIARIGLNNDLGHVALTLQPLLAITGAFFREQHVHQLQGVVAGFDGETYQPPRVRVHHSFAQLQRIHFTESLEARHLYLAAFVFRGDAIEHTFLFGFVDRKSTRLNSSHVKISYAVFCLK